jgi:hypothetical protein
MWTDALPQQPKVSWSGKDQVHGPQAWQRKVRTVLEVHHGEASVPRAPRFAIGPIGSSDRLIKDPRVVIPWISTARNLLAVEMESSGVYRATRERCAMLSIRAISDIVGLTRSDAWTTYACASVAAFTRAYLNTQPIGLGHSIMNDPEPIRPPPNQEDVFPRGFFRTPGTIHLHIDGGAPLSLVEEFVQRFNERAIPTKLTHISSGIRMMCIHPE